MPSSRSLSGGVSRYRAVVAVVATVLVAALLYYADASITIPEGAMFVLFVAYLLGSAFDRVRAHPLYDLASAVLIAGMFGFWYLASEGPGVFPLALFALTLVGVVVEAYNYRHGTAYLRIE